MSAGSLRIIGRCFIMTLSEKEVEDLIFEDLTENFGISILNKGLLLPFQEFHKQINQTPSVKWVRQLNLDPYGIADIVGFYRYKGRIYVDLLELKACAIESPHFDQIFRYHKGIQVYLRQTFDDIDCIVNCILIGNGYNTGNYIQNHSDITVASYDYDINGLRFSMTKGLSSWSLKNDDHCSFRKIKDIPLVRIKPGVRNGKTF